MPNRLYRNAISGLAFAVALLMTVAGARAFDDSKYPDFNGQWKRPPEISNQYDISKPRTAEEAPLTPESGDLRSQSQGPGGRRTGHRSDLYVHPGRHAAGHERDLPDGGRGRAEDDLHHDRVSQHASRIYTDGRDWPKDFEPSFMGYSIGKWTDADPNGRYQTLEVETRLLKGPRAYDFNGIPLHADNETVVKERIFLDKANPDMMHDEIATFDHAQIHPWKIVKMDVRVQNPIWFEFDLRGEQRAPAHRQGELHDERGRLPDAGQEGAKPLRIGDISRTS